MATLDEIKGRIGSEVGVSEWILVDQAMIDKFADATGDNQFIHVDPAKAKMTPFGGTIAHGFLTVSLLSKLLDTAPVPRLDAVKMAVNYGANKIRFLAPVPSGKRIRGRFKLAEFDEKRPGQYQQTLEATVEIEGQDKPAMIAEWIIQVFA